MPSPFPRRNWLQLTLASAALLAAAAWPLAGQAQDWPAKPIRIIVPYAPGGFTDQMARLIQPGLQQALGTPVVVDNRPGGNSLIGVGEMARAAPDGYTFAVVIAAYAANTSLYDKLPYDPANSIAGVSLLGISPLVAGVGKNAPYQTLPAVLEYAKAHPGELSYGSSGNGSSVHLTTELLKLRTGVDMVHVPYKGAALALADLMGGHIQLALDAPTTLIEQSGPKGRVQLIGVAGPTRLPAIPDVPTFAEQGIEGADGSTWAALIAPKGVPPEIMNKVSQVAAEIVQSEAAQATLQRMGTFPEGRNPAQTDAFIADETAKWAQVIQQANIRLD
ncbi:tripartite tricarboxylate transporter substrate binding protein [Lampropedia aestuarii]|uniref:Tripartite tricarboxylate transporter substrate binding protein n=1 Tax=Lampropedia aestuarii TaxID=2562762 RepID=A0A4S5C020_9BURK|nr:tripartite tricarboxylate transporter substrate-binding protein [Lampropedia aestuarii]THJ35728.1 tripartite tricarboxylate transporter substrate binding protein [Lampropedia aestuarii]